MIATTAATDRTMKAIVQDGTGSADVLKLRDVERPVPTEGRVLVRVHAASVNALDWHSGHGGFLIDTIGKLMRQKDNPVRGVDLAGRVEAVGANVTRFAPGDAVFGGAPASFAEYASAHQDNLVLKPRSISSEQAATIGVAGRTALQGLRDKAGLRPGQRVLINGAGGGVGTFAVQIAKALGGRVTAVTSTRNLELDRTLGADELIDYTQEDFTRGSARYDIVFDVVANRSISHLRRTLAPNGTLVLVGAAKRGSMLGIVGRIASAAVRSKFLKQRIIFYVANTSRDDLIVLKVLIEAGKITPAIDRTYPLTEATEAIRYVGSGQARAKVVITMEQ